MSFFAHLVSNSEPGEKQMKPAQGRRKLKSFSQADKEIPQPQATVSTTYY